MDYTFQFGRERIVVRETLADRIVRYVDPERGTKRLMARAQMAALAGGYTGGSKSKRTMAKWRPGDASADAAILPDLPELRDRSSDLLRNEPIATGAISAVCTNVVGTGLALRSVVDRAALGWTEEQASEWQRTVQRRFSMWAMSTNCDITRGQTFYGLQDLALRSTLEKGDTFALLPYKTRPGWPFRLAVQLIEADRVTNKDRVKDTPQLAGGIEMDQDGAPIRIHILREHPGNILLRKAASEWDVVDVFGARTGRRNVLHLFDRLRIGQTRGVPYLAPVVEHIKQIGRYTEAEISAAVVSSFFAVFVKSEGGRGFGPNESATSATVPAQADKPAGNWSGELSSGLVADLNPGESIEVANPGRPNTAFEPFVEAILRQIGVALELPFEVLIKHFTSSYTAARAALLDAWRFFMKKRHWLADNFCQPIYEAWLADEVALGRISAPGFFADPFRRAAYCGSQWVGDAPGSVDPPKEALATEKNLALRRTTLAKETMAYDGSDWEDNHEQIVNEARRAREDGFLPVGAQPAAPPAPPPDDREDDDNTDPEDNDQADPRQAMAAVLAALTTAAADRKQGDVHVNVALPETLQHQLVERLEIAGLEEIAGALKSISRDNAHQMAAFISNLRAEFQHLADAQQNLADQPLQFEYDAAGNPLRAVPVKNR